MKWMVMFGVLLFQIGLQAEILANFGIDLETGLAKSGYNDVAIPGDSGSRFSLSEDLKAEEIIFFRFRLNYALSQKSELSFLYAPLKINSTGKFEQVIDFFNESFAAESRIDATYIFNSYRLTYKYKLFENEKWQFKLGLTAKIREAEIRLENDDTSASKTNVGFVPIIYFSGRYQFAQKFGLEFSGDALAAPQGRAEDVLFALLYDISPKMQLKLGYRILEGGSDNDEVYTFALINYAVIGLYYNF